MGRFSVTPWLESKVHGSDASVETARLITRAVFAVWFLIVLTAQAPFIRQLPIGLFNPVGFLKAVPASVHLFLLQADTFQALKVLTLFSLGCAAISSRFQLSAAVASCLFLTLIEGIYRSFGGHVNHTDLVFLYAAYLVTLFPLVDHFAGRQKQTAGAVYVAVIAFMLVTYMMTGVFRLAHGRLDVFLDDSITYWTIQNSFSTAKGFWQPGRLVLDYEWIRILLKMGFPLVTLIEALAPLCLISKPFRVIFLIVMAPFHVLSWLFLKIFFWHNLILFVLLLDFDSFVRKTKWMRWVV